MKCLSAYTSEHTKNSAPYSGKTPYLAGTGGLNILASQNDDEWLTLRQAADMLGMHPATVRLWADRNALPSRRTGGGHRRFRRADIEAHLRQDQDAWAAASSNSCSTLSPAALPPQNCAVKPCILAPNTAPSPATRMSPLLTPSAPFSTSAASSTKASSSSPKSRASAPPGHPPCAASRIFRGSRASTSYRPSPTKSCPRSSKPPSRQLPKINYSFAINSSF